MVEYFSTSALTSRFGLGGTGFRATISRGGAHRASWRLGAVTGLARRLSRIPRHPLYGASLKWKCLSAAAGRREKDADESMTTKPEKDPVRVEVELTREQALELTARSEWERKTIGELIRRAIDAYLKQAGHSDTRSR